MQTNGELRGLKIARGVKNANHSQFANGTILLGGASVTIVERFRKFISTFVKASYGKVSDVKSKIYVWNYPARTLANISKMLGYEGCSSWNSFRYLGVPIHKGNKKSSDWKDLVEKIKNKIHTLGAVCLNPTGKVTLLNVVLAAYPIFIYSIALAPSSIVQEIEKELRRFLWQGGKQNGNKKLHLIS